MQENSQDDNIRDASTGISNITKTLQQQARDLLIDVEAISETVADKFGAFSSKNIDKIVVNPNEVSINASFNSITNDIISAIQQNSIRQPNVNQPGTRIEPLKETVEKTLEQSFNSTTISNSIENAVASSFGPNIVSSAITQAFNSRNIQSAFNANSISNTITTAFNSETIGGAITTSFNSQNINDAITTAFNSETIGDAITNAFSSESIGGAISQAFSGETIGDAITNAFSSESIGGAISQAFSGETIGDAITNAFSSESIGGAIDNTVNSQNIRQSTSLITNAVSPMLPSVQQILPNYAAMRNVSPTSRQQTPPVEVQPQSPQSMPSELPATRRPNDRVEGQPIIPNIDSLFKNMLFGLVPKRVIRGYVSKVKYLADQLAAIRIPQTSLEPIVKPLDSIGKAIDTFSNISWVKAFVGIKAFRFFTKSFISSIEKLTSDPEVSSGLEAFKDFSKKLAEPLEDISTSITDFAKIAWGKVLIGSTIFTTFIKTLAKIPVETFAKVGTALEKPLETLGNTLERFGKSLSEFIGPLMKGALAMTLLGASLIPLAYGLKMFGDIPWESIVKGTAALGGLVLLAKTIGNITGPLLKGALGIAALGVSLLPLAYSLKMMENVGLGSIAALAASLATLGVAAAIFGGPQAAVFALGAGVIALLGASMIPLAYGLKLLSEANPETLSNLAMPLLKLGGALLLAAPGLLLGGAALLPFSAGLAALGSASKLVATSTPETLSNLAMPLLKLGGALLLAAPGLIIGGAALLPFSAGLAAFGLATKLFNPETLDSVVSALSRLPDAVWSLAKAAPAMIISALALLPFSASLATFGLATRLLDAEKLTALAPALNALADSAWSLAKATPALVVASLGLIPFSAGIAALGFAVNLGGDRLLEFMDKMGEFNEKLDPEKLFSTAKAIVALSGAIAAFGVAQAAEGFGNLVGRFLRFGADSPLEQMQKFAAIGEELKFAGTGILDLSTGISKLSGLGGEIEVLDSFPWEKLEDLAKAIEGKSIIQIITGGGIETKGNIVEAATGKSTEISKDVSMMTNEEKAVAAGYDTWEEYAASDFKWQGKPQSPMIEAVPSNIGAELSAAGTAIGGSAVIINNNNGGNVSNVSTSSVNNTAPPPMPIFTGSALGFV